MGNTWLIAVLVLNIVLVLLTAALHWRLNGQNEREVRSRLSGLETSLDKLERSLREESARSRSETTGNAKALREEVGLSLNRFNESVLSRLNENMTAQETRAEASMQQLRHLTQTNEERMEKLRETIDLKLREIRDDNGKQLEEMRKTVDEKLNATLERRLGESFKLVGERLEMVHKGLGEMQQLASGVGDLKRVLSNVKTRGIWGEFQLGNILEQVLTPEQYERNVATKPNSNERVEFAIKLPGRDKEGSIVWLPIDAKFPQEDYQRLVDAQEQANAVLAEEAAKALENRVKAEAKDIAVKYLSVPYTTEFGILFLPTEGLYAEVLRRPGLCDTLMHDYRVVIAGPTTLAALLNSLQMGFRTLAIERRSSEVWTLLGTVKTEFGKFGELLDKTSKKLHEASNSIEMAARKSRTIERKLKNVQELPENESLPLTGIEDDEK